MKESICKKTIVAKFIFYLTLILIFLPSIGICDSCNDPFDCYEKAIKKILEAREELKTATNQINELKEKIQHINEYLIPPGTVAAFNLNKCPLGWVPADGNGSFEFEAGNKTIVPDLRSRFIRGIGDEVLLNHYYPGSYLKIWTKFQCHNAIGCADNEGLCTYLHQYKFSVMTTDKGDSIFEAKTQDFAETDFNSGVLRPENVGLLFCVKTP